MSKPFYNEVYDQWRPHGQPKKKRTWWKWVLFAVAFALLFNGCVENAQYRDNYVGVETSNARVG